MAAISQRHRPALCAEGRAQLEELKAKFQYPDVPLVFCSPMLRAQQTAEVLFPNAKLTILQDLREMNFGKFENRPITELVKDPEFAQWMDPTSRTNRWCRGPQSLLRPHQRDADEAV